MKKVININFQGRIIPIEETAFELLKQYIESLRRYFANEEGREEIINDIQDRIGELFNDCLKKGATCITDADLETVINNMGRPEDFEAADEKFTEQAYAGNASVNQGTSANQGSSTNQGSSASAGQANSDTNREKGYEPRGRLFRNEADKVLGGICSGIANYLKIDPVVVRILFVIIAFGSFGASILVYFVLWVLLPAQGLEPNIRKRLYRNPDDRMIGGVCGGIAAYFNLDVWVPRLIFAAPFLIGVIVSIFRVSWFLFDNHDFPISVFNGFGGSMLIIYVILWAVLPEARTASEKLEMKGAKIDLESIKNTVQDELQSIKGKAVKMGGEFSEKAQEWGQELKAGSRSFAKEATPIARKTGSGFIYAIGMIFKVFFFCIAGIIAFALLVSLIAVLFGSVGIYSIRGIFLEGFWENFFVWATLFLFLGIPIIAIATWIIRLIIGRRSRNHYFRYVFGALWILGLISAICLTGLIFLDYQEGRHIITEIPIQQPAGKRLLISALPENNDISESWNWVHLGGLIEEEGDSVRLENVRLNVSQSDDSGFHIKLARMSRGKSFNNATENAQRISYALKQEDSVLFVAKGFTLGENGHFRVQGVIVNVLVPVGKHIIFDESTREILNGGHSFSLNGDDEDWSNKWLNDSDWETGVDYVMTPHGLERADGKKEDRLNTDDDNDEDNQRGDTSVPAGSDHKFRYHQKTGRPEQPEKPEKPEKAEQKEKSEQAETPAHTPVKQVSFGQDDADNITSAFYHLLKSF
jgi:phage shock protein PspC (stress-responsive transcriptional regulator)